MNRETTAGSGSAVRLAGEHAALRRHAPRPRMLCRLRSLVGDGFGRIRNLLCTTNATRHFGCRPSACPFLCPARVHRFPQIQWSTYFILGTPCGCIFSMFIRVPVQYVFNVRAWPAPRALGGRSARAHGGMSAHVRTARTSGEEGWHNFLS